MHYYQVFIRAYISEYNGPVLETISNFINADDPTWEGTATELIEKLELDIKPNALSLKLNINAGKLYDLYFVQYSNSRSRKGRKITLRCGCISRPSSTG